MDHPLRSTRLFKVSEAEVPGRVLRVDDVAHPECQRLTPHHNLVTQVEVQRPIGEPPPGVAHGVLIVKTVEPIHRQMAGVAAWQRREVGTSVYMVVSAIEGVRRL